MNVSNTISQDSGYAKNDPVGLEVKKIATEANSIKPIKSELTANDSFGEKMKQVEKIDDVIDAINKSNKNLLTFDRKLELSVHQKTKEVMIKVIDTLTDEVIREIPSEKVLDTVAHRKETLGILMDQKI